MVSQSESPQTSPKELKVLIVEDYELSRNGLSFSLEKQPNITVVGEAENGQIAIEMTAERKPHVILMDIRMPVLDGISATQQIKERFPETKVIMLTSHQDGEEVYASLAAGADAYCMKDIKLERLVHVIEMVRDGAFWLDPAIAQMVMKALPVKLSSQKPKIAPSRNRFNVDLTERELEVLGLLVDGQSNKEIATTLCITLHTVKAHVCNIIQKLAVDDRTQAAVKAIRDGLVKTVD
ncbi:MAG: response regulator transcription factor [Cyanobacteria bacterium]|nr:response regulator transcription factor [Cyanobacteriota bacterium]